MEKGSETRTKIYPFGYTHETFSGSLCIHEIWMLTLKKKKKKVKLTFSCNHEVPEASALA